MSNTKTLTRIQELEQEYKRKWRKDLEYYRIPDLTQEKMIFILEQIVKTGESFLVGYQKYCVK